MKKYIVGLAFLAALIGQNVNAANPDLFSFSGIKRTISQFTLEDKAIRAGCLYMAMFYVADPVGDRFDMFKAKHWDNKNFNDANYSTDNFMMCSSVAPAYFIAEQLIFLKNKHVIPFANKTLDAIAVGVSVHGKRALDSFVACIRKQKF